MTTIFISGKITGDENYREKFGQAAGVLEEKGYIPLSPAILPEGLSYGAYMRICAAMLIECDGVLFLPDWIESKGAREEFINAHTNGKRLMMLRGGELIKMF